MPSELPGFLASGNINPCRFVNIVPSEAGYVEEADATDLVIGVSQKGTYYAPGTAADSGYAGITGVPMTVHGPGQLALIELGGTVSAGDILVPDADGKGTTLALTATATKYIGGYALADGASGGKIPMIVWPSVCRTA